MRRTTLIVIGVSLIFVLFVFYSLLHQEPIQISGGRLERAGGTVILRGIAINTGSAPEVGSLKVKLFDSAGHTLSDQTLELGKLSPGQSISFASPAINASKAEKFTIQVDHGANMYGN
ncbi:MAG TPA: FxLYD domain-containing protein [Candidatus Binataceae bacterium]|jgi:hypothetical protein|nr:FxLYD domain-containing protein [Candidatus Binataceae bacterium]